jgi:hypothetical protein
MGTIEPMGEPGKIATVTIAPGQTGRYEFSFTPPGLYAGAALFTIAALASAAAWRRRTSPIF